MGLDSNKYDKKIILLVLEGKCDCVLQLWMLEFIMRVLNEKTRYVRKYVLQ